MRGIEKIIESNTTLSTEKINRLLDYTSTRNLGDMSQLCCLMNFISKESDFNFIDVKNLVSDVKDSNLYKKEFSRGRKIIVNKFIKYAVDSKDQRSKPRENDVFYATVGYI